MPISHRCLSIVFTVTTSLGAITAAAPGDPVWPTLPVEQDPPLRTEIMYIYMEGPWMAANDHFWGLLNTRFQIRADTRLDASGSDTAWAGNNFPGDNPADNTVSRSYAGPTAFGQQVVNRLQNAYAAAAPYWPAGKPKRHSFQLIGPNGLNSPWRDVDNPHDYIPYGGPQFTFHLTSATVATNGTQDTVTSADLATFGTQAVWQANHTYGWGDTIVGDGYCFWTAGGTSGAAAPTWDPGHDVYEYDQAGHATIKWQNVGFGRAYIKAFSNAANNGIFYVDKKLPGNQFVFRRHAAGGDPYHMVAETHADIDLYMANGPTVWHDTGRLNSQSIALANFQAMKSALDAAKASLGDIERSFVYYTEDDESLSDYKPVSVSWAGFNVPTWQTDGLWELNAADPRCSTYAVDGMYTVNQMLARAGQVINGGTLATPVPNMNPWSPQASTLRAWHWINTRSAQSIISQCRFLPFIYVFGDLPCGNWNMGVTSGDPAAHIVIEPHGGELSTGIAIDNYTGSTIWGMSIPGMYGGVLGDYRGYDNPASPNYDPNETRWNLMNNWKTEAQSAGYPLTTRGQVDGTLAQAFQVGQVALREYASSVRRNYGYSHVIMPSLTMQYGVSDLPVNDRNWLLIRLANDLNRAYNDGLIDSIWMWEPQYPTNADIRACWYTLASQLQRLHTKPADYDLDGQITQADLNAYMAAWNAADPIADFNDDGQITVQDFTDYIAAWMAG